MCILGSKIFFDEPPPIDEDDDDLFGNNKGQLGIFSGTGGLFDDLEDDNYLIKKDDTKKSSESIQLIILIKLFIFALHF